jgi:hypothetical protein
LRSNPRIGASDAGAQRLPFCGRRAGVTALALALACTGDPTSGAAASESAIPAGRILVRVVAAAPELGPFRGKVQVAIGERVAVAVARPEDGTLIATFEGLPEGSVVEPRLVGPYLTRADSMTIPSGRGAIAEVLALPLEGHRRPPGAGAPSEGGELHVSLAGDKIELRWEARGALLERSEVAIDAGGPAGAATELSAQVAALWKRHGLRDDRGPDDRDVVLVHAPPAAGLDQLARLARAVALKDGGEALVVGIVTWPRPGISNADARVRQSGALDLAPADPGAIAALERALAACEPPGMPGGLPAREQGPLDPPAERTWCSTEVHAAVWARLAEARLAASSKEAGIAVRMALALSADVRDSEGGLLRERPEAETARRIGGGYGGLAARSGPHRTRPSPPRLEDAVVSGPLTVEVVRATIEPRLPAVARCYEAGLFHNPNLEGEVSTRFVVGIDGIAGRPESHGTLPDAEVIRCIEHVLAAVVFPSTDRVSIVTSKIRLLPP